MMDRENSIVLFNQKKIRRHWDEKREVWYFSIVDVVEILTGSTSPRKYWNKLAQRLRDEGSELVTKFHQLKLKAPDGKKYLTDVADTETLLRLVQSIPSPRAEPLKLWLARIGYERIEETEDPEKTINRALLTYQKKGYSQSWINQRLKSIEVRKELTDEWQERGVNTGRDFAILTDEITKAWTDRSTKELKRLKGLKKQNLRDHMSNLELVLTMLAEASTTEISKQKKPEGMPENKVVAREGGGVAKVARKEIEGKTGKSIIGGSINSTKLE